MVITKINDRLLNEEIKAKLPALYSTEEIPTAEKIIVCKFSSLNTGWSWYVVEGEEQEDGDYLFYGLVDGMEREWGYFSLYVLESVYLQGSPCIECDMTFSPVKVGECSELKPQNDDSHYIDPGQVKVDFFAETNCQRCGKELNVRIMSKMNEDVICPECADAEKKHPLYEDAAQAELAEVKAGKYNYPGLFAGQKYPFDLKDALIAAYNANMRKGIKTIENALQKVIEERYPGKPWWKTCNVSIFSRLFFDVADPSELAEEIVTSIEGIKKR